MPPKRSNVIYHTRAAKRMQRLIANQNEEERASATERRRQRMAQMRAERRAARFEDNKKFDAAIVDMVVTFNVDDAPTAFYIIRSALSCTANALLLSQGKPQFPFLSGSLYGLLN
ncbi:unnamed protein product [Onchocerca ochengi]|uniref:IBB domain-containing protein n=1 Tax=Onchocerca ochengi TaxID=42157 RepID=A0A182EGA5_ONCOC|nr:unnamed protein product [Onchocerca ochengi]